MRRAGLLHAEHSTQLMGLRLPRLVIPTSQIPTIQWEAENPSFLRLFRLGFRTFAPGFLGPGMCGTDAKMQVELGK